MLYPTEDNTQMGVFVLLVLPVILEIECCKRWFEDSRGWMMGRAGAWGLGWRVEHLLQAMRVPWDLLLHGSLCEDKVPHHKPSELRFAASKEKS